MKKYKIIILNNSNQSNHTFINKINLVHIYTYPYIIINHQLFNLWFIQILESTC